jgi:hypothetical protein
MKSLRLKRGKHSKSRKLKKGGNGNNFNTVLDLIKNCVLCRVKYLHIFNSEIDRLKIINLALN